MDAISTAASGIDVGQTWMDTIAGNVANMNDVGPPSQPAYQQENVDISSIPGGDDQPGQGAEVSGISLGGGAGQDVYQPSNPVAGAGGMVSYPNVDLADQLVGAVQAGDMTTASVAVINRAEKAYSSILSI